MITILTPTFNRAHTLERAFLSLIKQTDYGFEWLVVNDGSTDQTSSLIRNMAKYAPFRIRLVVQENGGKHTAINAGVSLAKGDWIFILDSDDALTPDAVASVRQEIKLHKSSSLVGICFRRANFHGQMIGKEVKGKKRMHIHPTDAGGLLEGDLAYIFKRSALIGCPFPVFPDEKFVPELFVWNKLGDLGLIVYRVDRFIYLCDYLPDGYTFNFKENLRANPKGFLIFYSAQIKREAKVQRKIKCIVRSCQCLAYLAMNRLVK